VVGGLGWKYCVVAAQVICRTGRDSTNKGRRTRSGGVEQVQIVWHGIIAAISEWAIKM